MEYGLAVWVTVPSLFGDIQVIQRGEHKSDERGDCVSEMEYLFRVLPFPKLLVFKRFVLNDLDPLSMA